MIVISGVIVPTEAAGGRSNNHKESTVIAALSLPGVAEASEC